jgi:DNA polymerase (family 10)
MPTAKNAEVADFLENIADLLELKGESTFRIRAYREAARNIEVQPEDITEIIRKGKLCEIPGVGESIASKVREFLETGQSTYYEDLKKQVNPGLAQLIEVPGVGAKKAVIFYSNLGIDSVDKLEQAAREHMLAGLPKIGEKTEQNILEAIERLRQRSGRTPLGIALPTARQFLEMICDFREIKRADLAGSLRRMRETIGDLDLLAASTEPEVVIDRFTKLPMVKTVLAHGPTKGTIVTADNLQVDLRVVKPEEWGAALQYFTGSKPHNIKLRGIAIDLGYKLNEYGVFRVSDDTRVAGETEAEVYSILGIPWMPPEVREDLGEVEAARAGKLPHLIELSDLRGDCHVHTDWSDGHNSPEEMVQAAIARGYEYVALSDHSVSMGFVHGLTVERIREQRALIDELNRKYRKIRVLQGIEVNIRADATLDYEDEVLEKFDIVTASIHGGMGMPREKMTRRIIAAIRNHHVDVLGHPTGRIIGKRDPYEVDLDAVFKAAAESNTAMEINSWPDRLDLKDTDARRAKEYGVSVIINTDSHSVAQYELVEYGVATARRGWIEPKDVLNTLPVGQLLKRLR